MFKSNKFISSFMLINLLILIFCFNVYGECRTYEVYSNVGLHRKSICKCKKSVILRVKSGDHFEYDIKDSSKLRCEDNKEEGKILWVKINYLGYNGWICANYTSLVDDKELPSKYSEYAKKKFGEQTCIDMNYCIDEKQKDQKNKHCGKCLEIADGVGQCCVGVVSICDKLQQCCCCKKHVEYENIDSKISMPSKPVYNGAISAMKIVNAVINEKNEKEERKRKVAVANSQNLLNIYRVINNLKKYRMDNCMLNYQELCVDKQCSYEEMERYCKEEAKILSSHNLIRGIHDLTRIGFNINAVDDKDLEIRLKIIEEVYDKCRKFDLDLCSEFCRLLKSLEHYASYRTREGRALLNQLYKELQEIQ